MIKIDSVTKDFEEVRSLDSVSVLVDDGSIFGLIGSNGSGKSTLLRIICGIYKPTEGEMLFDGVPVWENPLVKRNIVYLSDEQYFLPHSTIYDMMQMYKSVYPDFSLDKYNEYLTLFGLDDKRKISTFSKGMQKQASFLLGLSCRTKYILCDETLDGLDPVMRRTVCKIVAEEVAERNVTVIFASHNLKEIEDICDHVALLHKGQLILEAELDDIKLGIHKIQMSFPKDRVDSVKREFETLSPVSLEQRGSLFTLIARGEEAELSSYIDSLEPVFVEFIPLTLEEIFIAEMEERGYDYAEKIG
ncbi:MAG: ABC transporter ATP-binding protein [Ruminococcaceae bacterium]|nr:ABC transporter ATP-binding protein [Oscillospiraceae bacterium]